jgi:hypothetical protein
VGEPAPAQAGRNTNPSASTQATGQERRANQPGGARAVVATRGNSSGFNPGVAGGITEACMSKQVVLDLPESAFSAFRVGPAELGREMRLAAAVKWYELGKLSQAKAAEFAGLSRYEFIHALARFEVSPVQETPEELAGGLAREK